MPDVPDASLEAERQRLKSLKLGPADFQRELGDACYQRGHVAQAAEAYRKAIAHNPKHVAALCNLGAALVQLKRFEEAADACRRAAALRPDAATYANLAAALSMLDKLDEATAACDTALALDPRCSTALTNLGGLLNRLGDYRQAEARFRRSLAIDPRDASALHGLGFALDRTGDRAGAVAAMEAALAVREEPAWRFEVEAMKGSAAPASPPAEYVTALFDQSAATFDQALKELGYVIPGEVLRAVTAVRSDGGGAGGWNVIDLGCGTGLSGEAFRPLAHRLVGVDLSPKMVALARQRGIYDELHVGDMLRHLDSPERYDLVLACDVFIYVGDLSGTFAAAAKALRRGGLFAFSVEADDGDAFCLRPDTRRYAHSEPYLRDLAAQHGMRVDSITRSTLRRERGNDVTGMIAVLAAAAGA